MLKTFIIKEENKHPDRLVENVKYQIRKYIKREKRKALPEKAKCWHFDCQFAKEGEELRAIEFKDITKNIDESASSDDKEFKIEILAKAFFGNTEEIEDEEEQDKE